MLFLQADTSGWLNNCFGNRIYVAMWPVNKRLPGATISYILV
jgi:hypothetical protein